MNAKKTFEKSFRTKNIAMATIALVSILLATCMTAAPVAAQEEIVWQHDAIMPWDAERLSNNNTLITEFGNHTVVEVTPAGDIVWQYGNGTAGSGSGQLNCPLAAKRLSSGNTLITDNKNQRVIVVNPAKVIVWQYGSGTPGSGPDQLNYPKDAERLASGNMLIADTHNDRIIEVNMSYKSIVWVKTAGLNHPVDADRLSGGNTLIADYRNHRVVEVNQTGEIVWQYGTTGVPGSGVNELNNPTDAEQLPNGNILIADYINDRVIVVRTSDYDPSKPDNGFTADSIVWEHESNHPTDAERLSSSNTLICEAGNNRVLEVAPDILPVAVEIPPVLYDNLTCEIDAVILNNGSGPTGPFNASLTANGSTVDKVRVHSLRAGVRAGVSFSWSPSNTGDFKLCVIADSDFEVIELNETNNVFCTNVTVLPFTSCWNDTFDDESRIADKHAVIVHDGDVEMDLENVTEIWMPSPIVNGLLKGQYYPSPQLSGVSTIAYNLRGDGKWIAIMDSSCSSCKGFYWNDTQWKWIEDNSLVSGLTSTSWSAIAFNITGSGTWNIITSGSGYYWDGTQWVEDPSLVAGLGSVSTIAFNITGDGKWNAIAGSQGYYWNVTQWVIDPRLGGLEGWVQVGFNMTGDGRWNAISGNVPARYWESNTARGWYWNGTQWVEDPSLVNGFPGILRCIKPVIAFNMTGDGRWNAIGGIMRHMGGSYWTTIQGYEMFYPANIISDVISLPQDYHWLEFHANDTSPEGTEIAYKILDEWNNTLMHVVSGQVLTDITDTPIRLFAELRVNKPLETPVLHNWSVCWEEGLPASGVLKEKKRLTFDPNLSVNPDVATDSEGNVHVVWSDGKGGDHFYEYYDNGWKRRPYNKLHYKKLAPGGTVLVADRIICCDGPGGASGSRIAVDSRDEVHVVFNNGTNSINVSYMKLDNNGNTLIEPKQVISGVCYKDCGHSWAKWNQAKSCGIAVDGSGEVHVVACCNCGLLKDGSRYRQDLKYVKLDTEGNVLVNYTIEHITAPGSGGPGVRIWDSMDKPSGIAVDSEGNAYTAYTKGLCGCGKECSDFNCWWPSCLKVYYVKIDGEGVHKQALTGNLPLPSLYPTVCVDSADNRYVVWSQHNRTATIVPCGSTKCRILHGFDFYLSKFDKSGNKVIDRKRLTFEDYPVESGLVESGPEEGQYYVYGVRRPIIDTESGVIHAAWSVPEPKAGENGNIGYMTFDTSGSKLMDRVILSPPSAENAVSNPNIASVQDGAHLTWEEKREHDAESEIYSARLVLPPNRVFLMPPSGKWTAMNVTATYAIGIMHTMPGSETFNLTWDNLDGADVAELNKSTITLAPNTIGEVILNVTDAVLGDYRVKVSVESQSNPGINASAIITTSVITPKPDLVITAIDAYHNDTSYPPYLNLSNEVDVIVENVGAADATDAFNVSLYAEGEFVDKKNVSGLVVGSSTVMQFKWTPIGKDCEDGGTSVIYTLKVIADCDDAINESKETNNNLSTSEKAYWAGYSADEHLNAVTWHGTLRGGLNYTTGDGGYTGLYSPGDTATTHYDITLPAGASVELARLNVYYTWSKADYPVMEVSIDGTVVPLAASYNDRPCPSPAIGYEYPFGNYVYDLTGYISGSGTYTVTVKNAGPSGCNFCIAAPGLVILYEDDTEPEREFWILEGADLLEGGRRGGAGYLALEECICNGTFIGDVDTGKVDNAALGIVSAWGGTAWGAGWTSYYWFNDCYLGAGSILGGYSSLYDETIGGMSMHVGASGGAQVGANVSDVTAYIAESNNTVSFGDDGDSMMACNAFLIVERCREEKAEPAVLVPFMVSGSVFNYSDGTPINNPDVTIKNVNTGKPFPSVETQNGSNYYQILTNLDKVSCGDVLRFTCNRTSVEHRVRQSEIDAGGFVQNVTVMPPTPPPWWRQYPAIVSGIGDVGERSTPAVFNMSGTWYQIAGESDGTVNGYNWTGTMWQPDSAIVSGLGDAGDYSTPAIFYMDEDETWYLISGRSAGDFAGYRWTGTAWESYPAIVSDLGTVVSGNTAPAVFCMDETWYLISGNAYGRFDYGGRRWDAANSTWVSDTAIVSGLGDVGEYSTSTVFNRDGTWYLIAGTQSGTFTGYRWTGSVWKLDSAIVSGLGDVGEYSAPAVFNMDETWYLISGDGDGTFNGYKPKGACGDVNEDKNVDDSDVILLAGHVRYPAVFEVHEWAADVNCDGSIDIGDVILLNNHVRNPALYPLNCYV